MFSWLNFLTYAIITAATPGPNNIMSMSNAGHCGFKKSLSFNLGIGVGFSIVMLLCALFCNLLSAVMPQIELPMLIIGAGYMLFLAWKTWNSSGAIVEDNSKQGFLSGFALQFINPKIYIYCIISMEAYILPYYNSNLALLGFALLLAFIGFIFTLLWAFFGSVFKQIFSKYSTATNAIMALLLVYCAISLFL